MTHFVRIALGAVPVVGPVVQGGDVLHSCYRVSGMGERSIEDIRDKITVVEGLQETQGAPWLGGSLVQLFCTFCAARIMKWSPIGTAVFLLGIGYFVLNVAIMWRWNPQWINRLHERFMSRYQEGVRARYEAWKAQNAVRLAADPTTWAKSDLEALNPSGCIAGDHYVQTVLSCYFIHYHPKGMGGAKDPQYDGHVWPIVQSRIGVVCALSGVRLYLEAKKSENNAGKAKEHLLAFMKAADTFLHHKFVF